MKAAYRAATERMGTADRRSRSLKRKVERKDAAIEKLSAENARFVKYLSEYEAKRRFPDAEWEDLDGIVVAKSRQNAKSKNALNVLNDEMETAKILLSTGSSVWLLPESSEPGKKADAIVDGLLVDFKHVKLNKIEHRFSKGMEQAQGVCIRIKEPGVEIDRIYGKLRPLVKGRSGILIVIIGDKVFKKDLESFK